MATQINPAKRGPWEKKNWKHYSRLSQIINEDLLRAGAIAAFWSDWPKSP